VRKRLRPAHSPEQLGQIYATPHDHTQWQDHVLRVDATIDVARKLVGGPVRSAADLSCGSAAVLKALDVAELHLGDYAPGYQYCGPIEETIHQIPPVDLFVCTETVEHLDDPDQVLRDIRAKTSMLVLSTPVDNWEDRNVEHYWAWSEDDVVEMLAPAGFEVDLNLVLDFRRHGPDYYAFTILGCR
jgi:hypothetical protein